MAKRKRQTAPAAGDLSPVDAEFRTERAEPAQQQQDKKDADRLRQAQKAGLLIEELPLGKIVPDHMVRDRQSVDPDELEELKTSIAANGLRLPIEVHRTENGNYNLISGYRRFLAVRQLGQTAIKALVVQPQDQAASFVAMVEENEMRQDLSPFERGRIAVLAARQGAFETPDAAVSALFASASAAKRSKVKCFAEVFEVMGDLLQFPADLSERKGLRLSYALRQGEAEYLRNSFMAERTASTASEEWETLEGLLDLVDDGTVKVARRGRKPIVSGDSGGPVVKLDSGISLQIVSAGHGFAITIKGRMITSEIAQEALALLAEHLSLPD